MIIDPHNRSSGTKQDAVLLANRSREMTHNCVNCPGFIIAAVKINICCKTLNRTEQTNKSVIAYRNNGKTRK